MKYVVLVGVYAALVGLVAFIVIDERSYRPKTRSPYKKDGNLLQLFKGD